MTFEEENAAIAEGRIPPSFVDLTRIGTGLVKVGAKVRQTLAVIVATARLTHFGKIDKPGWIEWCTKDLALDTNTRCHLWRIGVMLIDVRDLDPALYKRLFQLDADKLLSLSSVHRLETAKSVIDMAAALDLAAMSREDVRAALAERLGLPQSGKRITDQPADQPVLPGFDELLTSADAFDDEDFVKACDTPAKAARSMELGIGFLTGALEYNRAPEHRDTVSLAALKSVLLDQLAEVEKALTEI